MMLEVGKMDEIIDCPRCRVKMKQATRENVTIDYCTKCGGLWLDKGEMEKLLEIAMKPAERLKKKKIKSKKKR